MTIHKTQLKYVSFTLDGNEFRAQLQDWKLEDNTDEPESVYTYGADGQNEDSAAEEPAWNIVLKFFADWRTPTGLNHYLWTNAGQTVDFEISHNLGTTGSDPQFTGQVKLKRTPVGGTVRTDEITDLTLKVVSGHPGYVPAA